MTEASKLITAVNQYGYLSNKNIAALFFADDVRKAQRLTQRAVAAGTLVETKIPGGGSRFATPENASLLDNVTGHRDAANALVIDALLTGYATSAIPDRQVQINQAGYSLGNKIPDGLLLDEYECDGSIRTDYTWVEIENSERSGRDVGVLGTWLMNLFLSTRNWHVLPPYRTGYITQVIIAISAPAAEKIENRLTSFIRKEFTSSLHASFISEILPQRLIFIRV